MAFPCCNLTYVKYLNPDGTIDDEVRDTALKEWCEVNRYSFEAEKKFKPCTCICHTKGMSVLH